MADPRASYTLTEAAIPHGCKGQDPEVCRMRDIFRAITVLYLYGRVPQIFDVLAQRCQEQNK
jgi:hypothetical protein